MPENKKMEKYNEIKNYIKGYTDALDDINDFIFYLKENKKNFEIVEVTINAKVELFNKLIWTYKNYQKENEILKDIIEESEENE